VCVVVWICGCLYGRVYVRECACGYLCVVDCVVV